VTGEPAEKSAYHAAQGQVLPVYLQVMEGGQKIDDPENDHEDTDDQFDRRDDRHPAHEKIFMDRLPTGEQSQQ